MLKKIGTLSLVLFLVTGISFAQVNKLSVKKHLKVVEQESVQGKVSSIPQTLKGDPTVGEVIAYTTYDNFTNDIVRKQIIFNNGQPYFFNMLRPWGNNPARRACALTYLKNGVWVHVSAFDTSANAGWPDIDVQLTGSAIGTIGIVAHTPCRLGIWDPTSEVFTVSQFEAYTDPSIKFMGDNIFLATSGNRALPTFYETSDYGGNFALLDTISNYTQYNYTGPGSVEVGMAKSPDETKLAYFGLLESHGSSDVSGVTDANSAKVYWINSTDAGTTWTPNTLLIDGKKNVLQNYPVANFAPYMDYEGGQIDAALTNAGTIHMVANGFGFVLSGDTTVISSPVIYYNSNIGSWKAISDIAIDTIQAIGKYAPGRAIGQSYPSIAVSEDGKVILALWTGPQVTGGVLDTAKDDAMYYWRDLYYATSTDGGNTFTKPAIFVGAKDKSECFGHIATYVGKDGNNYTFHTLYLEDQNTGSNPFGGASTLDPIVYKTITVTSTGVNDQKNLLNSFELSQNYPNPFNPSTIIKYSLAEKNNVSLKVYDMLGREVASLINGVQDAGSHQISFNGKNLASGMYIYTIKSGNFSESKKMLLMK